MLSNYKIKKIENNLQRIFKDANNSTLKSGVNWYKNENSFCKKLANKYNLDIFTIASVYSALSPRNKLEKNKIDCINVIEAYNKNILPENIKVSTFHSNKYKAFDILASKREITTKSLKTYSFVSNLLLNDKFITVDVWHLRACFLNMKIIKNPTKLEYLQLQDITLNTAKKYNLKGYEFQAIVWEQIRNNYKQLTT